MSIFRYPLTLCVYDAPAGELSRASRQARSHGINAWILEDKYLSKDEIWKIGLPFCIRWQGPFDNSNIALKIAKAIKPLWEAGRWAHQGDRPIVILSQPEWKPPSKWIQSWLKTFSTVIDPSPIIFHDFGCKSNPNNAVKIAAKIGPTCQGSAQEKYSSDLDFREYLYIAHHVNPLSQQNLIPLIPPPRFAEAENPVEPSEFMKNHIPREYKKLWKQTEAVARILAPVKPLLAIRIVTSWQDHHAASCVNIKPFSTKEIIPKLPSQVGTAITRQPATAEDIRARNTFALSIHGYHVDLLLQMLESDLEEELKAKTTLFVSLQRGMAKLVARHLEKRNWQFELIELPNRGRDVLPFSIYHLPRICQLGYHYFAKVHTKKSVHLKSGGNWGQWLAREILEFVSSGNAEQCLFTDQSAGLIAPRGSVVPMTVHLAENVPWLEKLIARSELSKELFISGHYIAGTMMIGRVDAISSLLELGLTEEDFEEEAGQLDGTLAHALERMIGAACINKGLLLKEFNPQETFEAGFGYKSFGDKLQQHKH